MSVSKEYLLTLKVAEKYIDVKLNHSDTKLTIYQKITKAYPNHHKQFDDLMLKIKRQLQGISSQPAINEETKESLRMLIRNIFKEQKIHVPEEWALSQITVNSQVRSCLSDMLTLPEKICYQKSIQTQPTEDKRLKPKEFKTQSSSVNKQQSTRKKDSGIGYQTKSMAVKKTNHSKHLNGKNEKSTKQKQNKTKCNPDIIKACEVIMKKSNNNGMRSMAKQFLKEKGYLNQEVITQERDKRKTYLKTQAPKSDYIRIQSVNKDNQRLKTENQNQLRMKSLLSYKNVNQRDTSAQETKVRSKYNYNISPKTEIQSYSLNITYQKQSKQPQISLIRAQKKYNYLQN